MMGDLYYRINLSVRVATQVADGCDKEGLGFAADDEIRKNAIVQV